MSVPLTIGPGTSLPRTFLNAPRIDVNRISVLTAGLIVNRVGAAVRGGYFD